jgi:L-threonylcarbamoyladenylate synthase
VLQGENGMAEIVKLDEAMEPAREAILAGELVALPTETVYGLAADATSGEAVARIFEAKGRPSFNPLIIHVSDVEMARRYVDFDDYVSYLSHAYWPGPLTFVLPLKPGSDIHPLVTAGLDTIAIRMPRGFARDLIAAVGRPLAAPSANSSGRLSPTSAEAVVADLGDRIALVVDGGRTSLGVESTILKVESSRATILRHGGVTIEEIRGATGGEVLVAGAGAGVEAPGMLASHYAPAARLRLDADTVAPGEALLAFGAKRIEGAEAASAVLNLSERGHVREAAKNLFSHLRELDAGKPSTIAVEPIPEEGLGAAINDRLRRAAAPRGPAS